MNELMNTILHRRAIRRYEEAQIEEDVLQQILQAGYALFSSRLHGSVPDHNGSSVSADAAFSSD